MSHSVFIYLYTAPLAVKHNQKRNQFNRPQFSRPQRIFLSRVSSTRFMGVYADPHLDWKDHINNISAKVARNVGVLARACHFLSKTVKVKLYYALVFPC